MSALLALRGRPERTRLRPMRPPWAGWERRRHAQVFHPQLSQEHPRDVVGSNGNTVYCSVVYEVFPSSLAGVNTNEDRHGRDGSSRQLDVAMWWRVHSSARFAMRAFATRAASQMEVAYARHGSPTAVLEARKATGATAEACGPQDVAVRWLAAPINPADLNMIQGTYPIKPELPAIGGNEGVAVVERAGAEVQSLQEGDWVIPKAPGLGTWRNQSVHNHQHFMRVPSDLPVSQVATASINPCTALRLLNDFAELQEGDVVVQNGGNSSVGRCVIQLAAARGIKTVNLVRERPRINELQEELRALGATAVVAKDDAFAASKMIGRAKLGLNCIGGELSTVLAKMLDDGASLVTYGGMSKRPLIVPTSLMIFKDIKCYGFWLTRWTQRHGVDEKEKMMKEVLSLIRDGELHIGVEEVPLSQFKEGVELAMSAYRSKKVVLKCSE